MVESRLRVEGHTEEGPIWQRKADNDVDALHVAESARATTHSRKQRVDCKGHQRPPKCFPNLDSFRQVDAESEIAFSKKDETFQESQGILSPLRLPIPPRPLMPKATSI
jgi:hypothetical protein